MAISEETLSLVSRNRWRHTKTGTIYTVICLATAAWDAKQMLVVYRSDDLSDVWVRSATEFLDGRFEAI